MISIFLVFEKCQLFFFLWVFWERTTNDDKSVGGLPEMRLILKLSYLPSILEFLKTTSYSPCFDSGVEFGYNRIPTALLVEKLYYLFAEESRISPKSDTG